MILCRVGTISFHVSKLGAAKTVMFSKKPDVANLKSLGILHGHYHLRSAPMIHQQNFLKVRLISTWNTTEEEDNINREEEIDEREDEETWDERFPLVHDILVKDKGKNARWKDVTAILTQQRDKRHRSRRVWISYTGDKPTTKELKMEWPLDKQTVTYRKLRDDEEDLFRGIWDELEGPREFTVTEKISVDGRRCWREVIKKNERNDEEEEEDWDEWMREEGFYDEIDRLMEKE